MYGNGDIQKKHTAKYFSVQFISQRMRIVTYLRSNLTVVIFKIFNGTYSPIPVLH